MDYNKLPVITCKKCFSINIWCDSSTEPAEEGKHSDEYRYCRECGSVEVMNMAFETWEDKYERAYGKKFIEQND